MFSPYLIPHLAPLFVMIGLCFAVAFIFAYRRFTTFGQHPKGYFKLARTPNGSVGEVPAKTEQASRNYTNLFEVPVIFYVATFLLLELRIQNETTLILSWGFVLGRIAHSAVHLGPNKVAMRALCFWISCLFLIALWIYLAVRVFFYA